MADPAAPPQIPNPLTLLPIPDPKPVQAFLDGLQTNVKGVGDGFISTVNQAVGGLNGTLTQGLDTLTKLAKGPFDAINEGITQAQAGAPGGAGAGAGAANGAGGPGGLIGGLPGGAPKAPIPPQASPRARVQLPQLPTPREYTI